MLRRAFYAGTFDPITNGHIDLVERAARLFDEIVVGVAASAAKQPLFTLDERVSLVKEVTKGIDTLRVIGFTGLLIDCMRAEDTHIIIRGLRAVSDFEYEFQLAAMNRRLDSNIETVFLTPSERHTFVSASLVKEIAALKGDVSQFLHPSVYALLQKKLG